MDHRPRNVILLILMLTASLSAVALKPKQKVSGQSEKIGLDNMIPDDFGEWKLNKQLLPVMPPPELEEKVNRAYDETLSRSYVNSKNETVMLSIAYGGDQTGRLRVHRPESCYSGQGFQVTKIGENLVKTATGDIMAKRLAAQSASRHEPITYWIRIGDSTVTGLLGQRLTQLRYGLTGEVPDGLIFRVSSIDDNNSHAYTLHDQFVADLVRELPKSARITLVGNAADHTSDSENLIK